MAPIAPAERRPQTGFKALAVFDINILMVEKRAVERGALLKDWLVAAGLLVLFLSLCRGLLWLYGFPEGPVKSMVILAGIGMAAIVYLAASRHWPRIVPPPRQRTGFDAWSRRQILVFWMVGGWFMSAFIEGFRRIQEPVLSFDITANDVIDMSIIAIIFGGFMVLFTLKTRSSRRTDGGGPS